MRAIAAVVLLVLAGCAATPYKSLGVMGGVDDPELDEITNTQLTPTYGALLHCQC